MILNKVLVTYMHSAAKEHLATVKSVCSSLKNKKINYKLVKREHLKQSHFKKINLVIAIGGDGTFLSAAQFIKNKTPLLGVNSNIKAKEGFFMSANRFNFRNRIERILKNKFRIKELTRLKAKIGNKKVKELALNEFYIGTEKAYDVFRCTIKINGKKEKQKNSGVIIGTASGSYAWLRSCRGKTIHIESDKFQYVVREPYQGKLSGKYKLVKGILNKNQTIEVTSETSKAILVADSLSKEYRIGKNTKVKINVSGNKLRAVYF